MIKFNIVVINILLYYILTKNSKCRPFLSDLVQFSQNKHNTGRCTMISAKLQNQLKFDSWHLPSFNILCATGIPVCMLCCYRTMKYNDNYQPVLFICYYDM